jgi:hypothetical protein
MKTQEIEALCHDDESRLALETLLDRASADGWTSARFEEEFDNNDILLAWTSRVSMMIWRAKNPRATVTLAANDDYAPLTAEANKLTGGDADTLDLNTLYEQYPYGQVGGRVA